jgi:hypothetical protein
MNDGFFVRWGADDEAFTGWLCRATLTRDVVAALTWQASAVLIYRLI